MTVQPPLIYTMHKSFPDPLPFGNKLKMNCMAMATDDDYDGDDDEGNNNRSLF